MIAGQVCGQIDAGQVFFRIHAEPVAEGAVPAPFTDGTVYARKFRIGHHANAQPIAIATLGVPAVAFTLLGCQMIRGDEVDGFSAEDPDMIQCASV